MIITNTKKRQKCGFWALYWVWWVQLVWFCIQCDSTEWFSHLAIVTGYALTTRMWSNFSSLKCIWKFAIYLCLLAHVDSFKTWEENILDVVNNWKTLKITSTSSNSKTPCPHTRVDAYHNRKYMENSVWNSRTKLCK